MSHKANCGCPLAYSAKRTLKSGKVLYASHYGLKCWPFVIHNEKCPHYKVKTQNATLKPAS